MEQYIIKGGNPLVGEVEIGGAKNAALAILAAAIMTDETVLIDNLPDVNDVNVMIEAISGIGAMVQRIDRHTVKINGGTIGDFNIEYDYIKKIRASYYLLGALLGKYRRAEVALPGGCNIGSRPIDQHLKGFRALGADVDIEHGKIVAEAEKLKGTHLYFDVVTVGATINVMMAAAMADGVTIMENVAKEPHVVDVANFLNSMGANIRGAGTDVIKIRGVKSLHKTEYSIIPDQIEAGTFMFAAAATKGDVTVLNVIPKHLDATISKLVDIGCEVEEFDDAVRVVAKGRLRSTQVKTLPYPGYPTDMQPQIGVVLALAKGTSTITESIFENRFKYLGELARMGAVAKVEGNSATIEGVEKFSAARVSAPDLRAGAALCIAGLAADGITIVDDIVYIQRGYERFEEKLQSLGGMIEKVVSAFDGIVVIDEAYTDFSRSVPFRLKLAKFPNIVVLNTMSKAWGCAGIRLGMAFAQKEIIDIFNKVKYPYNINVLTQRYAMDALKDSFRVEKWINTIVEERGRMVAAFRALPVCRKIYPTDANFFLAKMDDAQAIYDYLVRKGIIVRNRTNVCMCENCLRVTIGTKSENNELLAALRQY